jgi:acyl-homoserine lactone acylase PvdQ
MLIVAAPAGAQVQAHGTDDAGGFRNILPPGTNGLVNTPQLALWESAKQRPPHNNDQLQMYAGLATAAPHIAESQIPNFYKDATFGVPAGEVASSESPEPGVTIERDKSFGVPHIYGDTRAALMFGIGYATAEDRLFFIDALRHAGQGNLAQFAGGANAAMDQTVWASEPYTQQDLDRQIEFGMSHSADGPQILQDATNYVAGINAYIAKAQNPLFTGTMMPAEYLALGSPGGPKPFTVDDLVSIATLVGGIFGNGGGEQLANAVLYQGLKKKFGKEKRLVNGSPEPKPKPGWAAVKSKDTSGFRTFLSFVDPSDPEAPTTVHGKSFPYQTFPAPGKRTRGTVALPDPGSVQYVNHVASGSLPAGSGAGSGAQGSAGPGNTSSSSSSSSASGLSGLLGTVSSGAGGLPGFPRSMSNALLISAAHSASGHPLAVMGPQVSYYTPEILMEEDIHGPGIDANGAAFPGVNLYVELGHGRDYAWSATSSGQNIVDTFAAPLCDPSGAAATTSSNFYVLNGRCTPMETLTRTESWQPNLADQTPAGSVTLQTQRTAYGIVLARAKIAGKPVVYTNLRSTYMHELDSALGFEMFNEPALMRNPRAFINAASHIGYTFNWFYTDDKHIAYFNSGLNPVRAPATNPLFPTWARFGWRGYHPAAAMTPGSLTESQTPVRAHPQAVDQSYLTSWNNKQAPGYNDAATGQQYASVFRSQLLDNNIKHYLAVDHGKLRLVDLINAMGTAGTQDLRGVEVLPYALKLIGRPSDPTLANAVRELQTWLAAGAHRINREQPGASGNYDQSDAVRIMDAWWPLLVRAEFQPALGPALLDEIENDFPINDQPGHGVSGAHLGSAFDVGFYGIVQKDLRSALRQKVRGPLNRVYCGKGRRSACRAALQASLRQAIGESPQQVYPADSVCSAGDQMCSDSIQFKATGAITQPLIEWINRPTFQQADQIQSHGPR